MRNKAVPATKLLTTTLEFWLVGAKVPANGTDPAEFHLAISSIWPRAADPMPSSKIEPQIVALFMAFAPGAVSTVFNLLFLEETGQPKDGARTGGFRPARSRPSFSAIRGQMFP